MAKEAWQTKEKESYSRGDRRQKDRMEKAHKFDFGIG